MRRISILVAALLIPLSIPTVPAASFFSESWENGGAGWTFAGDRPGLSVTCGWGISGCSLKTDIHCCGWHAASRPLDIPLSSEATTVVKLRFYHNLSGNDAWPYIDLQLDQGSVRLWLNHDQTERFRLHTPNATYDHDGGGHERFAWHEARILLRDQSVMAHHVGPAGQDWSKSPVLPLPGATRITGITLGNEYHPNSQGRDSPYFLDELQIYDTPACFPFTPTLTVSVPVREYPMDPGFTLGVVGGHASCPTSWTLNFGDGTSTNGVGQPPASIPHTYSSAGPFTATLTVTEAGDTRSATRVVQPITCNPLVPSLTAVYHQGPGPFEATMDTAIGSSLERCHTNWRLDFGDGSPLVTGIGASPVGITHTYTEPGVYQARFEAVRNGTTAVATKYFSAGPLEQHANGSLTLGIQAGSSVNFFEQHVPMIAPSDGTDQFTLRWNATVPSDLDAFFTRGGARLAISGCLNQNTFGVESCTVPPGADGFVITGRTAVNAVWQAHIKYV